MAINVYPPQYQSQDIPFTDWVYLFTLCLAPLIAHVFAGVPRPSLLIPVRPRWHDWISLVNPTAIGYRYAAIVERRIRAYEWRPIDIAAANALFWTGHGWSGSEQMVTHSTPYCALLPEGTSVKLGSIETLKTIITTLQAVQTMIHYNRFLGDAAPTIVQPAISSIFGSLSVLGLLRLFASIWLIDDYAYSSITLAGSSQELNTTEIAVLKRTSLDSLLQSPDGEVDMPGRYRPTSYWPSRIFRIVYFAMLLLFLAQCASWVLVLDGIGARTVEFTATTFSIAFFYFLTMAVSIVVIAWYFSRGQTTSTILPCVSHIWFKVYSGLWILLAVGIFVLSTLETFKTPCGVYTSVPARFIGSICAPHTVKVNANPNLAGALQTFGLASQAQMENGPSHRESEFWVANFTGICMGQFDNISLWTRVATVGIANYSNVTSAIVKGSGLMLV